MEATALFLLLLACLLLGTSSFRQWGLDSDRPLNVDKDLPHPWSGYGSSALSVSGLFGAYTVAYLLAGNVALFGVVAGAVLAIIIIVIRFARDDVGFEDRIQTLTCLDHPAADLIFWLCVVVLQWWLAISEIVVFESALQGGLGLSPSQSMAATLAIALGCYYYCLIAGYQAVFRTDFLQYLVLIGMAAGLAVFLWPSQQELSSWSQTGPMAQPRGLKPFDLYGALPVSAQVLGHFGIGLTLGFVPILGSPDAWKRVIVVYKKYSWSGAPYLLLLPAAVPLIAVGVVFSRFRGIVEPTVLPARFLFAKGSDVLDLLLLCGMASAFMSTFDSTLIASTHILLIKRLRPARTARPMIQHYRLLLAGSFGLISLAALAAIGAVPHPYYVALLLFGPAAIFCGLLGGSLFFSRPLRPNWTMSAIVLAGGGWALAVAWTGRTFHDSAISAGLWLTLTGVALFYLFLVVGYVARVPAPPEVAEGRGRPHD